jgi:protein FRA10AC1
LHSDPISDSVPSILEVDIPACNFRKRASASTSCILPINPIARPTTHARFIRDDEPPSSVSWEECLARAYESKLFKEYALIDLKHYKSRRLALRWRTAPEVVDGLGEDTCGSLRCKWHHLPVPDRPNDRVVFGFGSGGGAGLYHDDDGDDGGEYGGREGRQSSRSSKRRKDKVMPQLRAFELPFVYEEAGERKEALVKVKLCPRCQAKLTWKPGKEEVREEEEDDDQDEEEEYHVEQTYRKDSARKEQRSKSRPEDRSAGRHRIVDRERNTDGVGGKDRRREHSDERGREGEEVKARRRRRSTSPLSARQRSLSPERQNPHRRIV